MRQLNNKQFDTIQGASASHGEIVSSAFSPLECQKDEIMLPDIKLKHEIKIKIALDMLNEVRNDLKKIEKENGFKTHRGYSIRFSIDSIFEDEVLGFIYKHGLGGK